MTCHCDRGWVCEDHPDRPKGHDGCDGAGSQCPNPQCPWWADNPPRARQLDRTLASTRDETYTPFGVARRREPSAPILVERLWRLRSAQTDKVLSAGLTRVRIDGRAIRDRHRRRRLSWSVNHAP
jgi:hypothetical protein